MSERTLHDLAAAVAADIGEGWTTQATEDSDRDYLHRTRLDVDEPDVAEASQPSEWPAPPSDRPASSA